MDTYLYRHDEILTERPYGFDADEDGWLWEGCGTNRLTGHNLDTAECIQIPVPEMGGRRIYESFCWHGKVVMVLGDGPFYLVYDVSKREATRVEIPAEQPITWYGTKTQEDKLILFERSESRAIILDGPDATPRAVQCPFEGQLASGRNSRMVSFIHHCQIPIVLSLSTRRRRSSLTSLPLPFPRPDCPGGTSTTA